MTAVLVAYVPGPPGEAALRHAVAEARLRQARLVVAHTARGDDRVLPPEARAALEDRLAQLAVPAELHVIDSGLDIVDDLEQLADRVLAEVIVIGLRRRSQVGKLIMGSAATRILMHARRPVITVRG